ncbi:aminotransferase family protein [Haloferax volcanii]|uniref:Pyridoxal phosphate-dependent aminotransferase n=3 Tax=Haloferax volcanii TaxID=2246 RepID=D4GQY4_HALVD|nr:aspartate aminotransferase family protein [Haloferax volcanii]ADE01870.1 pyridoxal phosphate-dependent aminotransferase [Haloferax volcanii DS2]ELY31427.1 4-aminobutyrate aminotransferase [Haloferax volcanii DS2]MBS8120759.1 aspartate aminotransferase family protein [Haloferax volcanii]MBS8125796.1 aspartate aminotransferase family protein [Haloferax volcanii]MBS8129580.1 aspartate aminotransferase family protein [Haloferax volcanii]
MPEREPSGGSELNETERVDKEHVFGTWSFQKDVSPTQVVDADGAQFTTADGGQYVDFSSQLMCSNLGHSADAVIDAVEEQMRKAAYVSPGYTTDARAKLGKKLAEVTPGDLSKTFFSTSGTEAVEAAIKIARFYTGKQKVVSRYRSYHGATYGSISVTGDPRRLPAEPGIPGTIKAPDPYAYGSTLDPMESVEYIDEMLELEGDTVAAILVEPIVGSNGILVPPDEYLPRLKEIAHDHGALLICDEVMSGFGRTGEWFGCDVFDVEPDIMTMAKGLTGAYQPLGATIVTSEIAEHFEENMFCHGHTYSGHPAAVAAGLATIETYQKENLIDRANEMGGYVGERIEELAADHPSVGETRGVGLFRGIELSRRADERVPFGTRSDKISSGSTVVDEVAATAKENGAYVANMINTLIIAPPLTITKDEVDTAIDALNAGLAVSDAAMD